MFEEQSLQRVEDVARRLNDMVREVEGRPVALRAVPGAEPVRPSEEYRELTRGLEQLHGIFAARR